MQTYDAIILHVHDGKRQFDRLEVPFLAGGQQWEGYCWRASRGGWLGAFLHEAAKSREKVTLTTEQTPYGVQIVNASRIRQEVAS